MSGGPKPAAITVYVDVFTRRGRDLVRFTVHPVQRETKTTIHCVAELHEHRHVKSSSGHREYRPIMRALIELGGESWPIDLTLRTRDAMGFRMLLGREAIRKREIPPRAEASDLGLAMAAKVSQRWLDPGLCKSRARCLRVPRSLDLKIRPPCPRSRRSVTSSLKRTLVAIAYATVSSLARRGALLCYPRFHLSCPSDAAPNSS